MTKTEAMRAIEETMEYSRANGMTPAQEEATRPFIEAIASIPEERFTPDGVRLSTGGWAYGAKELLTAAARKQL